MTDETSHRGVIYPWQCDQMGHMNIRWYVGKFDEASWIFVGQLGLTSEYMRETDCGPAVVNHNISYLREMLAGDLVDITSRLIEISGRSIRFVNEMRNAVTGEMTATCETTAVHFDRGTRKSTPWPHHIRAAAEQRLDRTAQPSSD